MDCVLKRIQILKEELSELRDELDCLPDSSFYNYQSLISKIAARSKELDELQKSVETMKAL